MLLTTHSGPKTKKSRIYKKSSHNMEFVAEIMWFREFRNNTILNFNFESHIVIPLCFSLSYYELYTTFGPLIWKKKAKNNENIYCKPFVNLRMCQPCLNLRNHIISAKNSMLCEKEFFFIYSWFFYFWTTVRR